MAIDPKKYMAGLDKVAGFNALVAIVNKLDDAGRAIVLKAIGSELTDTGKRSALAAISQAAGKTDKEVSAWLIKGISKTYVSGANYAQSQLVSKIKVKGFTPITVEMLSSGGLMAPHLTAVNSLLSDAYLDFGSTMTGYVKGAERILNDSIKRQVRQKIAVGRLEGSSIREVKNTVRDAFADRGFTVMLDRSGREWSLGNYSEMLARTHIIKANNEGVVNRASDFGIDIVQVSSHGATDDICSEQEGKIYSISGDSKKYDSLSGNEPPFHPNCKHTLLLRPDLSEET